MMGLIFFAMRFTWGIIPVACASDIAEDKGVNVVLPESAEGFTGVAGELKVIEYVDTVQRSPNYRIVRVLSV
jgi:hypothetical protein